MVFVLTTTWGGIICTRSDGVCIICTINTTDGIISNISTDSDCIIFSISSDNSDDIISSSDNITNSCDKNSITSTIFTLSISFLTSERSELCMSLIEIWF